MYSNETGKKLFTQLYSILNNNYAIQPSNTVSAQDGGWDTSIFISVPETDDHRVVRIIPKHIGKYNYRWYYTGAKITIGNNKWMKLHWDEGQQEWVIDTRKLLARINDAIKLNQLVWQESQQTSARRASNRLEIAKDFRVEDDQIRMKTEDAANVSYPWGHLSVILIDKGKFRLTGIELDKRKAFEEDANDIEKLVRALDDVLKGDK